MERHRCKLCLKNFSNGRSLGGHMRSHMFNLETARKPDLEPELEVDDHIQPSQETESSSEEEEDEKEILYGLRENPKRSMKFVDPEFASVVLQDRESETESSKNPTRRRSKRTRKMLEHQFRDTKKLSNLTHMTESLGPDPEQPVSSTSGTTTDEDVAFCLMMLSRDKKWKYTKYEEDLDEETEESEEERKISKVKSRGKYKCDTCNKVFKSYQALGGHRASHKKLKIYNPNRDIETENAITSCSVPVKKIHECPYCFRVFSSGQALGGHKRSHVIGVASSSVRISNEIEENSSLIDLNLPAPVDEDDVSQIELSAVSDAEFVNQMKR